MHMWRTISLAIGLWLQGCSGATPNQTVGPQSMPQDKELIIVAAPRSDDPYYAEVAEEILAFHLTYADAVIPNDDFLVLTDAASYDDYAVALGSDRVAIAPQDDIWMRDFSVSNAASPILFRYTAEGQGGGRTGQQDADYVQARLAAVMETAGLTFAETDWLNDGGNYVDDYAGRIIVSRKFLADNQLSEADGRAALIATTGAIAIAFIDADEQGGLEHADGVVAFIAPNVVVMNSYPEDPAYAAQLRRDLRNGLPDVTLHELVTPYDGAQIYDERFGSACGLYTNMLVTPDRIYLPQFGIKEDVEALASVRRWSDKPVIPVRSDTVCYMGGGVRCMSWQVRGANAEALKAWARRS